MSKAYSLMFPMMLDDRVDMTNRMHYLALLVDDEHLTLYKTFHYLI